MKKTTLLSVAILFLVGGFATGAVAGTAPSPFRVVIENTTDQDPSSPFFNTTMESGVIDFFFKDPDLPDVLPSPWGRLTLPSTGPGQTSSSGSFWETPPDVVDQPEIGDEVFCKYEGQIGGYPMYGIPIEWDPPLADPGEPPFIELFKYNPDAVASKTFPIYAYSTGPGIVGGAEVTFDEVPQPPSELVVPSEEAPTIQAAIDLVAHDGTVKIKPGVFTEQVFIEDKIVHIQGSGAFGLRATRLRGPAPDPSGELEGMINFGPGGGGSVQDVLIRGGNGIFGFKDEGGSPAAVQIEGIRILNTGRAISGSYSDLTVRGSIIRKTALSAIELWHIENLDVLNTLTTQADDFGLIVFNFFAGPGEIRITHSNFLFNARGGIAVVGDAKTVNIIDCLVGLGGATGIALWDAGYVKVLGTHVVGIQEGAIPPYYNLGHGLLASRCDSVYVVDSLFEYCYTLGLGYFASGGVIQNTRTQNVRYGLVLLEEPKPLYMDNGNSFVGTEEDILHDGPMDVPDAPPLPPSP